MNILRTNNFIKKHLIFLMQMNQNQHHKKQLNIQINILLGNIKQKKLLLFLFEIDGEEKNFLSILKHKLFLKIYQYKDLQDQEKHKLLEDQLNQQMRHFQESKQQDIHKLDTLVKMQAQSFKITKIGFNNYKTRYQNYLKNINQKISDQVYLQILDSMLGSNWGEEAIWKKKLEDLKKGYYNDQVITIIPSDYKPNLDIQAPYPPQRPITRSVKEIANILNSIYFDKVKASIPPIDLQKQAMKYVEEQGIIFIDQIDKIAIPEGTPQTGKGVSTEGVQRDLLPLIQGATFNTKYGDVKTDHILFVASGSFSMSKVQDLIPELLGRLPLRVKLSPITLQEFIRILKEPEYNLLYQQTSLMKMQQVDLKFTDEAIQELARFAYQLNLNTENIGARRLHAVVEKVMEDISFDAPNHKGQEFIVTQQYVKEKLKSLQTKNRLNKHLI